MFCAPLISQIGRCAALLVSIAAIALPIDTALAQPAAGQPAQSQKVTPEQLTAFEAAFEIRRKAGHVPGAAVAIVQGRDVLLLKGYGLASVEKNATVTPDTMFQIASASKAFTGLSALMLMEDGKLKLDDRPHTFLPDFRVSDADIDANITVRDLLTHASGFPRTDVAWIMGKSLTRADLIKGIVQLKPTAKLRQRFQYQNLMYVAAGEVVGAADKTSFEHVLYDRIFNPLGMRNTNVQSEVAALYADRASGYTVRAKKAPVPIAAIDPEVINAAGGINSTVRDLAQWLKFLVARGEIDGRRLIKPETFKTFVTPITTVDKSQGYALGWFVGSAAKTALIEHGGNLHGFTSQVAFMPELGIGIVVLSNADNSAFPGEVMHLAARVFTGGSVGEPAATVTEVPSPQAAADLQAEVGVYAAGGPAQDMSVAIVDGQLVLTVPGQPRYPLEPLGNRRYRLAGAPAGFFANFRPGRHEATWSELYLEQPQGNALFPKHQRVPLAEAHQTASEALGVYNFRANGKLARLDIESMAGLPALIMAGAPAFPLKVTGKDTFEIVGLATPPASLTLKHGPDGFITGFTLRNAALVIDATGPLVIAADITLDELAAKALVAAGGAERLAAIKTVRIETDKVMSGNAQGLVEHDVSWLTTATSSCSNTATLAFGKPASTTRVIATKTDGFTQQNADAAVPLDPQLRAVLYAETFLGEPAHWSTLYKSVKLRGVSRRATGRVYLVDKSFASGAFLSAAYDADTYRLVEQTIFVGAKGARTRLVLRFADFRDVDGVPFPFSSVVTLPGNQRQTITTKAVAFNVPVDPAVCQPRTQ